MTALQVVRTSFLCPRPRLFPPWIISLWNFKKPSDIFSLQIERKRSKEYLFKILAVKESFEQFSFLELIFEKSKDRDAGLKHKQGFSETLKYLFS